MSKQSKTPVEQYYWEVIVTCKQLTLVKILWTKKKSPLLILTVRKYPGVKFMLHSKKVVNQFLGRIGINHQKFYSYWQEEGGKATTVLLERALQRTNNYFVFKGQSPNQQGESWIWAVTSRKHRTIPYKKLLSEIIRHAPSGWEVESYEKNGQKLYLVSHQESYRITDKVFQKVIAIWSGKNNTSKAIKVMPMIQIKPEKTFIIHPRFFRVKHFRNWSEKLGEAIAKCIQLTNHLKDKLSYAFSKQLSLAELLTISKEQLKHLQFKEQLTEKMIYKQLLAEVRNESFRSNYFVIIQSFARIGSYPQKYFRAKHFSQRLKHRFCSYAGKLLLALSNETSGTKQPIDNY
jgi:hypothetical protein